MPSTTSATLPRDVKLTRAEFKAITLPKRIKGRNERFAAMTDIQKRKAIALDALMRAANKRVIPTSGQWVTFHTDKYRKGDDLRTIIESPKAPRCECCALGGAIVGLAAWEDKIKMESDIKMKSDSFDDDDSISYEVACYMEPDASHRRRLEDLFGLSQLTMIEHAFERGEGGLTASTQLKDEEYVAISAFIARYQFKNDTVLYRTIFTSILNHPEGLFQP